MKKISKRLLIIFLFISVIFTTIAYAGLSTRFSITSEAEIKVPADIRVTNISLAGANGNTINYAPKYTIDTITMGFNLAANSTITYNVTVTNSGDIDQTIYNITTLSTNNENVTCTPVGYTIKDVIGYRESVTFAITCTSSTSAPNTNIVLKFDFRKVYHIEYNANGGSNAPSEQIKYENEDLTLTTDQPTRNSYVFLGWADASDATQAQYEAGGTYTLNSDKVLYAVWELSYLTVTLDNQDATTAGTQGIYVNPGDGIYLDTEFTNEMTSNANPITKPTKTGYTFKGYYTGSNGQGTLIIDENGYLDSNITDNTFNSNTTIYAKWQINQYTITVNPNNGEAATVYVQDYNTTINLPTPEKEGYTFNEWTIDGEGEIENNVFTVKDGTATLTADYIVNSYTLTINPNGGSYTGDTEITQNYNTTINLNTPTREGYTFDSWSINGISTIENNVLTLKSNTTITAIWTKAAGEEQQTSYKCKRATTLHTETCQSDSSSGCQAAGVSSGATITYGQLPSGDTYSSGDAFDCDVNGDGTYDSETERFYYVSDYYDTTDKDFNTDVAVLIYSSNVTGGTTADNTSGYAYYGTSGSGNYDNWHGPQKDSGYAYYQLPSTSQWSNISLYKSTRAILTETGTTSTSGGTLPSAYSYSGKSARFITAQEINRACNITVGSGAAAGELDNCKYLMENTLYDNSSYKYGYWLETPRASGSGGVWGVSGDYRFVDDFSAHYASYRGARPAIEILKSDINRDSTDSGETPITGSMVTVNPNGGSMNGSTSAQIYVGANGSTLNLSTPTKTGYTFTGWTSSETLSGSISNNVYTFGTGADTIVANFEANTYEVSLDDEDATTEGTNKIYFKYDDGMYLDSALTNKMSTSSNAITKPEKDDYTFGGYFTEADGEGTQIIDENGYILSTVSNQLLTSNTTLYAYWYVAAPKCRRASTLHTAACQSDSSSGCQAAGYEQGEIMTYGQLGSGSTLTSGDALDCDVNRDGTYDSATERFYYVSDYYDTTEKDFNTDVAVLIYSSNVSGGTTASNTSGNAYYGTSSSYDNYHGPQKTSSGRAYSQLPSTSQWSNISLYKTTRAILNEKGGNTTNNGSKTLPSAYDYGDKAARFLTTQELESACNITVGSYTTGELDTCKYLMENTKYDNSSYNYGYWLETPYASSSNDVWEINGYKRYSIIQSAYSPYNYGTRPAIEVLKTDIDLVLDKSFLTVNPNGGTMNGSTSANFYVETIGSTRTISTPTREGYTFKEWAITGNGTLNGTTYTFGSSSTTLTAIWKKLGTPYKCKRATTLHTAACNSSSSSSGCLASGYSSGRTITYGNLGTSGTLASGDAFDCDVNGDGTYDSATERFYYVSDYYDTEEKDFNNEVATLIYYTNVTGGTTANNTSGYAYYSSSSNNYSGPEQTSGKAYYQLPSTSQWSNISLYKITRAILTETGTTSTDGGTLPTAYDYEDKAARFITAQEINSACNITVGSYTTGELDTCKYLMENTIYDNSSYLTGYWLETPRASNVWHVSGSNRNISYSSASLTSYIGARPAIEVLKSDIEIVRTPSIVTVNPNGGTINGSSAAQVYVGKSGVTLDIGEPTPKNDAYLFAEWTFSGTQNGSLTGTNYTFGTSPDTLVANYNKVKNEIELDPNHYETSSSTEALAEPESKGTVAITEEYGVSITETITRPSSKVIGDYATMMVDDIRYSFEGYYTGKACTGTQYIDSQGSVTATNTTFDSDSQLYACWEPITAAKLKYNGDYKSVLGNTVQSALDSLAGMLPANVYKCERATTLHEATCQSASGYGCLAAGYSSGATITYGQLGTSGTLSSGDAFDCDVNGDGTYDSATERFYYVSDYYDTSTKTPNEDVAVLIYYTNVTGGTTADNTSGYAYDSNGSYGENWHGPQQASGKAYYQLPSTSDWTNISLYKSTRAILTETGTTSTSGGTLPTAYDYGDKSARFLTAQEINSACNITVGSATTGELDNCKYLMENTYYQNSSYKYGYWLETPRASSSNNVWDVSGSRRFVGYSSAYYTSYYGARPAIEILKSDISY